MHQSVESNNEVKFIRLVTGEDLITEILKSENEPNYILLNPLKIVYAFGEKPGVISIGLVQWVFPEVVESQEITIKPSDVITMSNPSIQMEASYWESLAKLEKSLSFDFSGKSRSVQADNLDNYDLEDYDMEVSSDDVETIRELLDTMKKTDKRKLH